MRTTILILSLIAGIAGQGIVLGTNERGVDELVTLLKSNAGRKEKADACRELARVGDARAVPVLAALLGDEELCHMARYALETIPSASVDKALRQALGQVKGRCLVGVIGSIGFRRDPHAVPALAKLLIVTDPDVAGAAARALGSIGTKNAVKALEKELTGSTSDQQLAVCEGLLRCAERLSNESGREAALEIYDRMRALPGAHQVRLAAWRGAILNRGPAGLPLLLQAIRNEDFAVSMVGARIAREMLDPATTAALARELPQLGPEQQVVIIGIIGQHGDSSVLPALFTAASQHDPAVSLAAIDALGSLGSGAGLMASMHPGLEPAKADADARSRIVQVLMTLISDDDGQRTQAAAAALGAIPGRAADEAILGMLGPPNSESRRLLALDLIARRRMHQAEGQLFALARGDDLRLRTAAARKLGELTGPDQLPAMLELLDSARGPVDVQVTEQALASASQRAPDVEAWARRMSAGWDGQPTAQKCALVRVMSAIGGTNALKTVRVGLADSSADVRSASLRALDAWNNAETAPDLLELARNGTDSGERTIALRGYLALAGQSDLPAAKRLDLCRTAAPLAKEADQKKMLLSALGELRSAEALKLIRPLLDDPTVKAEACTAAVTVSDRVLKANGGARYAGQVVETLERVQQLEPSPDLARRASELLEEARKKSAAETTHAT